MRVIETKFSEESINKFLVKIITELVVDDHQYIKHIKSQNNLETLDIIILLDKKKEVVESLYTALNYRLTQNDEIKTFFRNAEHDSFIFPAGLLVHVCDIKKYYYLRNKWNIIAAVSETKYYPIINPDIKEIDRSFLILLDKNKYYNLDREIANFWSENTPKRRDYNE